MRKIVIQFFDFLKRKLFFGDEDVGDVEIRKQKTFDKLIELEFGNLVQLSGFKPYEDRISNKIGISELEICDQIRWEQLEVGDIVWLKNGEKAPADLLILDARQQFCYVDEDIIDGTTRQIKKVPPELTSVAVTSKLKMNQFEYRKILSGKIEYTRQSKNKSFEGFIKMSKDPKGENLDSKNIIFRGSKLYYSDWIYGLVIYAGRDCKIYKQYGNYSQSKQKNSFFGKKAKLFYLVAYVHVLINCIISCFFVLLQPCFISSQYMNIVQDPLALFLSFIIEYLHLLPSFFYVVIDLLLMINDYYHNKQFQYIQEQLQDNQRSNINGYQMLRSMTLSDISLSNYVFFDKTGTITDGQNMDIKMIILDGKIFSIDTNQALQIVKNKNFTVFNFNKSVKELIENEDVIVAEENSLQNTNQIPQAQFNFTRNSSQIGIQVLNHRLLDESQCDEEEERDEVKHQINIKQNRYIQQANINNNYNVNNNNNNIYNYNNDLQPNNIILQQGGVVISNEQNEEKTRQTRGLSEMKHTQYSNKNNNNSHFQNNGHQSKIEENNEIDFINTLFNEYNKSFHECLLAIIICNQITSQYDQKNDKILNSHTSSIEQYTLQFASIFTYDLKCASVYKSQTYSPNYIISIQNKYVSYKILAINEQTDNRNFYSIIFRDPNSLYPNNGSILYSKILLNNAEIPEQIIFKDKEQRVKLEKQIQSMIFQGMRPLIYCKKELNDEQTDDYLRQYENLKKNLVQDDIKLQKLYEEIERDVQIIAVFGIQEQMRENVDTAIKQMRLSGLYTWMLTGDEYLNALTVGYCSRILDQESSILHLEGKNYETIKVLIREQLNAIQNESKLGKLICQNQKAYNKYLQYYFNQDQEGIDLKAIQQFKPYLFSIVVSSEALSIIFSDNYLRNHFYFICFLSCSVIGYGLTTSQKGWFVRMVQQKFPQNPKSLAIGDSYNDIDVEFFIYNFFLYIIFVQFFFIIFQMFKVADVSIQMRNTKYNMDYLGDIFVNDYNSILNLIFSQSRFMAEVYEDLLLYSFYRSFVIGYVILLLNIQDCTFGSSILDGLQLFFYHSSFYIVSLTSYLIKKYTKLHKYSININILVNQYKNNITTFKKQKMIIFFYKIIFHSFSESIVIYMILYWIINFYSKQNGKTYTTRTMQVFSFFAIGFTCTIKILITAKQNYKEAIATFIFYIVSCAIYLPLEDIYKDNPFAFKELSEYIDSVTVIILIFILPNYSFFFTNKCYKIRIKIHQIQKRNNILKMQIMYIQYILIKIQKDNEKNSIQKKNIKSKNLISRLIEKIFKQEDQEQMDIILKNMISNTECNEQNSEMNKFSLQFKNNDLENQFRQNLIKNWFYFNRMSQLASVILLEGLIMLQVTINKIDNQYFVIIIGYAVSVIFLGIFLILLFSSKGEKQFFKINFCLFFIRIFCKIAVDLYIDIDNSLFTILYGFFFNFIVLGRPDFILYANFLQTFIFFIRYAIKSLDNKTNIQIYITLSIILYTLVIAIQLIYVKYNVKKIYILLIKIERHDYLSQNKLRIESAKINNILSILLPKFVRDRISNTGEVQLAENQGEVGVLFCDICDFDQILQSENEKIIALLDNLFRNFDVLCSQNECTKIETVGKSYVASSGLSVEATAKKTHNQLNAVERLINLGFDMMNYVKNISWGSTGEKMKVKIGIHYGRVIAGVLGYHKPQFSLIGDTINTTSRVMSTGEDNKMTISEAAHNKIQSQNQQNYRVILREVEAKGKGVMITYQIFKSNTKGMGKGTQKITEVIRPGSKINSKSGIYNKNQKPIKKSYIDKNKEIITQNNYQNSNNIKSQIQQKSPVQIVQPPQQLKLAITGIKNVNYPRKVTKKSTVKLNAMSNNLMEKKENGQTDNLLNKISSEKSTNQLPAPIINKQKINSKNAIQQASGAIMHTGSKDTFQAGDYRRDSQLNTICRIENALKEELNLEQLNAFEGQDVDVEIINELFESKEEEPLTKKSFYLELDFEQQETQQFYEQIFSQSKKQIKIKMLIFANAFMLKTILIFLAKDYFNTMFVVNVINRSLVYALIIIINCFITKYLNTYTRYQSYIIIIMIVSIAIVTLETYTIDTSQLTDDLIKSMYGIQTIEVYFIFAILGSFNFIRFKICLICFFFVFINQMIMTVIKNQQANLSYFNIVSGLAHLVYQYLLFQLNIKSFNNLKSLTKKTNEQNKILSNLLPKHVLEKFLNNPDSTKLELVDNFEDVTILFADIAGFTKYSSSVEPEQVVNMLKKLFTEFDKSCLDNEVFKLYTIGDCYVVIGFTDSRKRNPVIEARNVANMGFSMIEKIKETRAQIKFDALDMRIGIHTGKIIGGVIGTDIVRYDIYGRDVVIANKLESNGEQGRILVSDVTRKLLDQSGIFEFFDEKEVLCKSIDVKIKAAFVQYKQFEDSHIKNTISNLNQSNEDNQEEEKQNIEEDGIEKQYEYYDKVQTINNNKNNILNFNYNNEINNNNENINLNNNHEVNALIHSARNIEDGEEEEHKQVVDL
ncbi:hypothetical protein IMG5_133420 [Ichthyophthirius multifiliis]|uniref:adenylate cyclase n=1 Tax=Ichthyophthirius multifiliis TaxID=5932 RepID=G0QWM8_ICHMU|nr:hypothetical protein IMG5_133420 [Ichthyophthirius multifiliis]EGR30375.1 hypothetical protein IMG5_133420 [Ichthyophthirius multifiliis]|eukprot:XP_004031962.1 hypothetical protein IMG5_133420 [Ichthyophthirius multifiliis]